MSISESINKWRGKERRRHNVVYVAVTHELSEGTQSLIEQLIEAVQDHGNNSQVLTAINNLDRKVDKMSSNLDRIEKEAADAAENVNLVKTALEELKTISEAMQAEITGLKEQIAQGQLDQARLDAAAAVFEKADDDMDALVSPSPTPEPEPTP